MGEGSGEDVEDLAREERDSAFGQGGREGGWETAWERGRREGGRDHWFELKSDGANVSRVRVWGDIFRVGELAEEVRYAGIIAIAIATVIRGGRAVG